MGVLEKKRLTKKVEVRNGPLARLTPSFQVPAAIKKTARLALDQSL
jgi:hypothetical protein